MGSSSSSTSNQKYNTNIVNITDTNILNKSVNNFTANTVVSKASECSASISQLQTVDLSGMKIGGDLNIGEVDQSQSSAMTFDCLQVDTFQNDIANGVMSSYMDSLKNGFSSDTLDKMDATAGASAKGSFGSTGQVNTKSNTNVDYNFNSKNETHTNIQKVVENAIQNNLSMESVKKCIAQVKSSQVVTAAGTEVTGSVNIGAIRQNQAATLMAECTQKQDDGNKITNAIAQELGVTIDNTNSVKKSTSISTSATAESVNNGAGEALGSVFAGIGSMFGNIFGGIFGAQFATMSAPSSFCCICCCMFLIILGVGGMMFASESETFQNMKNGETDDMFGGGSEFITKRKMSSVKYMKSLPSYNLKLVSDIIKK